MQARVPLIAVSVAAFLVLVPGQVRAQSLYGRALDNFDANKDGKISRDEVPEAYRGMFDRIAEQFKFDPAKTHDRKELEKILGVTGAPAAPPSSSGGFGDRNRGRSGSSRSSGSSPRSNGSRSGDATGDNRPFRTLVELPSDYRAFDKDGDGQLGLYEWPKTRIAEFLRLDLNDDGFLTISELKPSSRGDGKEKESSKDSKSDEKPTSGVKSDTPVNP